jgi:hypothetical protein
MTGLILILIAISAGFVLYSLARGLIFFARTGSALAREDGPSEMHLMQNRMMVSRIKWQAITILLLAVLAAVAGSR